MNVSLLFTSDWHLCLRNLENCRKVATQLTEVLEGLKRPRHLIHCGDIVGDRGPANPMDVRCSNWLIVTIPALRKRCDGFLFVRGNHDNIALADGSPSCVPLLRQLGVTCADDQPLNMKLGVNLHLYAVPYFRDMPMQRMAFKECVDRFPAYETPGNGAKRILVFHNEVRGSTNGNGGVTLDEIGARHYDLCVGGHVHRPQFIAPNVYVVGSPFPTDWNCANAAHRHLLIEV